MAFENSASPNCHFEAQYNAFVLRGYCSTVVKSFFSLVLIAGFNTCLAQATKPLLKFGYAEACPHMCPESENKGFTTDIARSIFEKAGYQVDFLVFPWARAAVETFKGKLDGVLSAGKDETPDLLFPLIEIAQQRDCFYGLSSDRWSPVDVGSFLDRQTIVFKGWVNESRYKKLLGEKVYRQVFRDLSIDQSYSRRVIELVKLGRADAFWMDINVFAYFKNNNAQLITDNIRMLGCVKHQNLYLALSPKNKTRSATLAAEFDQGMRILRSSGELALILQKYGLKDWH